MAASDKIEHIFSELYDLPTTVRVPYFKLKVQELLLFLSIMEISKNVEIDRHLSAQTEIIREIHARITGQLNRRFTIDELAREYLINTSTLKSVFKAVYGMPIASYMKHYRVNQGAKLLRETGDSIAVIAGKWDMKIRVNLRKPLKIFIRFSPQSTGNSFNGGGK